MSELAVPENPTNEVATAPHMPPQVVQPAQSALVAWALEARQAAQVADSLSRTSFVPASLRGKPADITAAILAGQELGLQPMATLRSIDVIQGTPALRAHAMRGLLQSQGHEIEVVESTDDYCKMRGRRAGAENWQYAEWTIDRAQRLGLTGKDQWKKQPKTMLQARATGEICRLVASDALYAMPYASEELDPTQMGFRNTAGAPRRATAAEILSGQAPALEPAGAEPAPDAPPVDEHADLIASFRSAAEDQGVSFEEVEKDFYLATGLPMAEASVTVLRVALRKFTGGAE